MKRRFTLLLAVVLSAALFISSKSVIKTQAQEEPTDYWGAVSNAEEVEYEFHDMILPLNDRFEINEESGDPVYYVDGDLCVIECMYVADKVTDYSQKKWQTEEYDKDGNPVSGTWNGKIENMIWKIYEYSYGETNFYYSFSAAGDTYHINVYLTGEAAQDREAAREWLFDLISETNLTEEGWEKEDKLKNPTNSQAHEETSESETYWKEVSSAEKVEYEFHDMILPLNDRFEINEESGDPVYYVDEDLCVIECTYVADDVTDYSREKWQTEEYDKEGNPVSGPWNGRIENMIWKIYEYGNGETNFYYSFSAAGDTYHINVYLTGEAAKDREAAREWLFDLISETDLTEEGWAKDEELKNAPPEPEPSVTPSPVPEPTEPAPQPLPKTDRKTAQVFYMSTFEELTGTTPAEFTASDPQPWTIYIIETGEEYSKGNRPVIIADTTEEEMSNDMQYTISDWELQAKYDDAEIIYTSDPNRASVILVQNREYVDSGREYGNGYVTAYSCNFTETIYNTTTHESATYQQTLVPGFTIEVSGNVYYESRMTLDDAYYNWRGIALSWLRAE